MKCHEIDTLNVISFQSLLISSLVKTLGMFKVTTETSRRKHVIEGFVSVITASLNKLKWETRKIL